MTALTALLWLIALDALLVAVVCLLYERTRRLERDLRRTRAAIEITTEAVGRINHRLSTDRKVTRWRP